MIGANSGVLKTFTITEGTPYVYLYPSPVTLPTAKPDTAQLDYTVALDIFPTFSFTPYSCQYIVNALIWGRSSTVSTKTVSYEANVDNGSIVQTGSYASIFNQDYWTLQFCLEALPNPVGKNIKFYVWDTAGLLDVRGMAVIVYATCPQLENNRILSCVQFLNTDLSYANSLSYLGNAVAISDFYNRYDTVLLNYTQVASSKDYVSSDPYAFSHYYMDGVSMKNKVTAKHYSADNQAVAFTCPRYPHVIKYRRVEDVR